jgi:hypothetical protein
VIKWLCIGWAIGEGAACLVFSGGCILMETANVGLEQIDR